MSCGSASKPHRTYQWDERVFGLIVERLPVTCALALPGGAITLGTLPLGIVATHRGHAADCKLVEVAPARACRARRGTRWNALLDAVLRLDPLAEGQREVPLLAGEVRARSIRLAATGSALRPLAGGRYREAEPPLRKNRRRSQARVLDGVNGPRRRPMHAIASLQACRTE